MRKAPWFALAIVTLMSAFAFAGIACDDDDGDGDGSPTAAATAGGDETPSSGGDIDISGVEELEDGTLLIGSDIAYAPMEFLEEGSNEPTGFDIDLGNALGEALGVEVEFENALFDTLIPALQTERYDALMSAMTASDERKEEVDFVEYFSAGSGIIVEAGNPLGIEGPDDLCGKRVAVQEGTVQVDYLLGTDSEPGGLSQECVDNAAGAIEVLRFGTDPEAVQALAAGQADAEMADFPVAAYSAELSDGRLEVIDTQIDPGNYGIAVRKDSALGDALQEAFDQLVDDGTYDELLAKWGLEAGRLE
jgi:polar amino acid transport system substrate-binding protein